MKFGYTILYVPDVETAVSFYERAFGLARRFVHESGQYAELETGATALAFVVESLAEENGTPIRPSRAGGPSPGIEIALVTDDVAAAVKRAVDAGAELAAAPKVKPWGQTVAWVRDPHGVLVELCTPMG